MTSQEQITKDSLEDLLGKIYDLRVRTYRLLEYSEPTKPGQPASELEISAIEDAYKSKLPTSYRLFLSIHNGWEHWSGDVALLSTEQILTGKYAERIRAWKAKNRTGHPLIESALVIGFSLFVGEQTFLDLSIPERPAVVVWDNREMERHRNFYEYLLAFKKNLEEELSTDLI